MLSFPHSPALTSIHDSQGYGFSSGHVLMWELDCEESWALENTNYKGEWLYTGESWQIQRRLYWFYIHESSTEYITARMIVLKGEKKALGILDVEHPILTRPGWHKTEVCIGCRIQGGLTLRGTLCLHNPESDRESRTWTQRPTPGSELMAGWTEVHSSSPESERIS